MSGSEGSDDIIRAILEAAAAFPQTSSADLLNFEINMCRECGGAQRLHPQAARRHRCRTLQERHSPFRIEPGPIRAESMQPDGPGLLGDLGFEFGEPAADRLRKLPRLGRRITFGSADSNEGAV